MKIKKINGSEKGFILFVTLMMLIIFAIVGIGLYQQTTMSIVNVQYMTFKQEAEDLAMSSLNTIESNIKNYQMLDVCDGGVGSALYCSPLPDDMINTALAEIKSNTANNTIRYENIQWEKLNINHLEEHFSEDTLVYYVIQQLGADKEDIGYLLYRITIIADVLGTFNVLSAVTAIPEIENNP